MASNAAEEAKGWFALAEMERNRVPGETEPTPEDSFKAAAGPAPPPPPPSKIPPQLAHETPEEYFTRISREQ